MMNQEFAETLDNRPQKTFTFTAAALEVDKMRVGRSLNREANCEHTQTGDWADDGASGTAHGDFGQCVAMST